MDKNSEQAINDIVAGASLAFGIVLLVQEGLGLYYAWVGVELETISGGFLFALFAILHLIGGFLGGYLVGRKKKENIIRAGIITAILAYIIEFIYNLIFVGSFGGNIYAVLSLVIGSIFGALFASRSGML